MSAAAATAVLGSGPVTALFRAALQGRLRVLAYHDIRDVRSFAAHVRHLVEHYAPVAAEDVRRAQAGAALPARAVWLTFDDAHPDVVDLAMPVLDAAGISAMLFVCAGVVDTTTPYWWQVVDLATARDLHSEIAPGMPAPAFRMSQKLVPDQERRDTVVRLTELLERKEPGITARQQVTTRQLHTWSGSGHDIGNHTWDHPLLDRCSPQEQRRQVAEADERLKDLTSVQPDFFAYPNGNRAAAADAELRSRRYQAPLLFDHAVSRLPSTSISRLRLDAFAAPSRMRAVASGAHSTVFGTVRGRRRHG